MMITGFYFNRPARRHLQKITNHVIKNCRMYTALAIGVAATLMPAEVMAAGKTVDGGERLILLLQQTSFWVGMGVTIWGVVEAQLDFPGWKGRVLKGVLGYIAILLIPLVFIEIRGALQIDVWQQVP